VPGREPLPDDTTVDDVRAAVQAAWLARDYTFVRELIEKYLDAAAPHHICFRCVQSFRSLGLYEFRYHSDGVVRLCDECWRATDNPDWRAGPAITVGASIRERYGDFGSMWVQCEAQGDVE
jgi:hypothetical protein